MVIQDYKKRVMTLEPADLYMLEQSNEVIDNWGSFVKSFIPLQ